MPDDVRLVEVLERDSVDAGEQTLDLDLEKSVDGSTKISASYPAGAADDVFDAVRGAGGNGSGTTSFDTNVTQDNLLVSLLVSFLPFVLYRMVLGGFLLVLLYT